MANPDGSTVSSSSVRPSALDTIFDVTTTTSPSRDVGGGGDERGQVVAGGDLGQALDADDLHGRGTLLPRIVAPARPSANMARMTVSELFDPDAWRPVEGFDFTDITYHRAVDQGTVRIAFDRPEVRNAFRPHTVDELYQALDHARMTTDVGCVLLTGNGPSPKDGGWAFCSGGDQRIRGRDGYKYAERATTGGRASSRAGPGGCTSSRSSG